MTRFLLALSISALCACTEPPASDIKVIVGATLISGKQPPLPHSVVVVKEDRISALGSQQMTPIPPGSSKVEAYGKFVAAGNPGEELAVGSKADLVLLSADPADQTSRVEQKVERRMVAGRWIP